MKDSFKTLNPEQRLAVENFQGPMLVLAGPGTGKTQLLSARVMQILQQDDVPASAILCLTFTESGAQNMRDRLSQFINEQAYQVAIHTYHGFAQTIINQYPEFFEDKNLKTVIDPITEHQFVDEIKDKMLPNNILKNLDNRDILATIKEVKSALLTSKDFRTIAKANQDTLAKINPQISQIFTGIKQLPRKIEQSLPIFERILMLIEPASQILPPQVKPLTFLAHHELEKAIAEAVTSEKTTPLTAWKNQFLKKNDQGAMEFKDDFNFYRLTHFADLFEEYNQKVKTAGLYDFSDMILETIKAIETNSELRFNLQEKYLYIMLDEYQDTNRAQSKLIELIADAEVNEGRPNIMAVGDDDQAIFAFQGADYSNMLNFYQRYRGTELINLSKNYRSSQAILDFSSNIAEQISDRLTSLISDKTLEKTLVSANKKLPNPEIKKYDFDSATAQNQWLADKINDLIKAGEDPNEIAIISSRHRTLEASTPFLLSQQIPLRYERSQNILDNIGIQAILKIAELITSLANHSSHNHLAFEVFSYQIWGLDTADIWQLSWANNRGDSFFQTILNDEKFTKLRQPALWCLEFAKQLPNLSLEACFDILVGNTELTIVDIEATTFCSPIKHFFTTQPDEKAFEFVLCLNLLRERFIAFSESHPNTQATPLEMIITLASRHREINQPILLTNPYQDSEQAVTLLTAFKAKGLEFKHVFLLEVNSNEWGGSKHGRNKLHLPDNLRFIRHEKSSTDEQLRLFFVAISRAKTNLFLLSPTKTQTNKPIKSLEFLIEVDEGNQKIAKVIPEPFQQIEQPPVTINTATIALENFDNFTDWKARHLNSIQSLQNLIMPRLNSLKLSPTSFNSFLDLEYSGPGEFFFNQILRFPSKFDIRTTYGSLVHATLDHAQKTTDFQVEHILGFYNKKLDELRLSNDDRQTLRNWGNANLPIYLHERQAIFTAPDRVETEVKISQAAIGKAILTGSIDRVEINDSTKEITIVDFKTGKTRNKLNLNETTLYNNFTQLHFYNLLLKASDKYPGYKIKNWRLEFLSPTPESKINTLIGEFDQDFLKRTENLLLVVWDEIQSGNFTDPDFTKDISGRKQFEAYLLGLNN